jgi:hypothetical protein
MIPDLSPILTPLLTAILSSGALSRIFEAMFPAGSVMDIPLEARRYSYGPATAVFCAAGCAVRVTVRGIATTVIG